MLSNLCPPSRLTSKKKLSYCPTTSPPFPPIKFQEKLHKKTMMIWKTRPTQNELLIFVVLWKLLFPILLFHVYMYQLLENCIVLLVWYVLEFFSYCFYFQILFYFSIVLSWYTFHFCVHKVCLSDLEWIEWNIKRQYVLVLIVFTN